MRKASIKNMHSLMNYKDLSEPYDTLPNKQPT